MEDDQALVKVAPGEVRIAQSFQDWGPGQVLYVDSHGRALSPAGRRRVLALGYAKIAGVIAASTAVFWWALGPQLAVAYAGLLTAWTGAGVFLTRRRVQAIRKTAALAAGGRIEDAHAALSAMLPSLRPGSHLRLHAVIRLAAVEMALRRHADALARLDPLLERSKRMGRDVYADMAEAMRVEALVHLGRFPEARQARDAFPAASESEMATTLRRSAILSLAFHAGAPEELPDDATLHAWAREGLSLSAFGGSLVLLSWAFHRRGDDDMARHLLWEAPSRMPCWPLEKYDPRLAAWMAERMKVWPSE